MQYQGDTTVLEPLHVIDGEPIEVHCRAGAASMDLIPNTSLQFLNAGIASQSAAAVVRRFFEDTDAASDGPVLHTVKLDIDGTFHHPVTNHLADVRQTYAIDGATALNAFAGRWLPIPYMYVVRDDHGVETLDEGPSNWARLFITAAPPGDENFNHRIVLAVDTTCCARPRSRVRTFASPSLEDAQDGGLFRFSDDEAEVAWFVTEAWVDDWLREAFAGNAAVQSQSGTDADIAETAVLDYLAHYLTLLAVLKDYSVLPDIRLIGLGKEVDAKSFSSVDLILDIGNSRTCALLSEPGKSAATDRSVTASMLPLRDLDQPWRTHSGLFSSRVEFSRASFGKEQLSRWSGRTNAFYWPSLVRVGPEAQRLVAQSHTTTDLSGLSGPMRYLWDEQPSEQPWRFARTSDDGSKRRALVSGPLLGFVSETGDVLGEGERPGSTTKPRFSRSSLLTFFANELILQAIIEINSPAYRSRTLAPEQPRRIGRIFLTVPANLDCREQTIMMRRLHDAVQLTWKGLGWTASNGAPPLPSIAITGDNATNAHAAYLHNEIHHKFRGKASEYFDLMGKSRPDHRTARAVRVACLDMGGGSIGLSAHNYELQASGAIVRTPLAVDGFGIGGDDIIKRIAECHIMPAVERCLGDCKLAKPKRFLEDVMAGSVNGRPSWIAEFGRRFAAEVTAPAALALLKDVSEGRVAGDGLTIRRTLRQLLDDTEFVPTAVIEEFDELAADEGADGFALLDAEVAIRQRDLKQTIASIVDPILASSVRLIEALDCDLVLLSGWTASLPTVIDQLLGGLATQPNRIVPLLGLRVHDWYPHLDETRTKIEDAKSTAAAGALIMSRAGRENSGGSLAIITTIAAPESRRTFIGRLAADGLIRNDAIMFAVDEAAPGERDKGKDQSQCVVKLELPATLGVRRLAFERWPASPLFAIDVRDHETSGRPKMPVELTIERFSSDNGSADDFKIVKVRDGYGNSLPPSDFELKLQTLASHRGHWSDTGALVIA